MNWGKSCGETTSPELQRYLAARKHQTLGEKGVFLSWCCSGCGALVARWASCCSWLYQRRKRGQKYPGTCQFYNSHSGKCQFYNNHSGKAGKYSDSVNNSLDILPFFFSFWGWQLPRPLLVVTLHTGVQLLVIIYPSEPQPPVFFSMTWMVKSLASTVI